MDLPDGFKQKTVIVFDQRDLQKLIKEVWDVEYDTGENLEFPSNDSFYDYTIVENGYDGDYYLDGGAYPWYKNETDGYFNLERVIERIGDNQGFAPGPEDVLTALAELGKLPYGEYQLKYWW
jgi:hypothetical protein